MNRKDVELLTKCTGCRVPGMDPVDPVDPDVVRELAHFWLLVHSAVEPKKSSGAGNLTAALVFLVLCFLSALAGFGIEHVPMIVADIGKVSFVVFLVLFLVSLLVGAIPKRVD